jgi:hypothetical protein
MIYYFHILLLLFTTVIIVNIPIIKYYCIIYFFKFVLWEFGYCGRYWPIVPAPDDR